MSTPPPSKALPAFARVVRRFSPYLRPHRGILAGSLVAVFAQTAFRILEPWPLKFVFDRIVSEAGGPPTGYPRLDALDPLVVVALAAVGLVLVTGLRAAAAYVSTVGFALAGNRVLTSVRDDLYRHLQRLSPGYHAKAKQGDITVRVVGDIGLLKEVAVTAALPLIASVLVLVGMVGVMLWMNWRLGLLALAVMPLYWLSTVRIGRGIHAVSRKQRKREGALAATTSESLGAIRAVQSLSLQERFASAFSSANDQSLLDGVQAKRLAARLERTTDVLVAAASGLVLAYGAVLVMRGTLTPGDLIVFLAYLRTAYRPLRDSAKHTGRIAKATAAGERVLEIFEREPEVRDLPGAVPAPPLRGHVRFEKVGFAYEPGHPVLVDVDVDIAPGTRVAIVGPSGNGKSTLVNLVFRLYDPSHGRVLIDGRDVRDYTLDSLRQQTGIVLQDTVLFAATLRDNIRITAPDATDEEVEVAARLANAHEFIARQPEGLDTEVGERGLTLSHGQRQRIAIARAALRKASVLVLDEPTAGLDAQNARLIADSILRISQGTTTLLVTHDLDLADRCDLVLVVSEGRIVERGSPAELRDAEGAYAGLRADRSSSVPVRAGGADARSA